MFVTLRALVVLFALAAVSGCGRCEASGDRHAQGGLCRMFDTKF
jgi:hypothetical protein